MALTSWSTRFQGLLIVPHKYRLCYSAWNVCAVLCARYVRYVWRVFCQYFCSYSFRDIHKILSFYCIDILSVYTTHAIQYNEAYYKLHGNCSRYSAMSMNNTRTTSTTTAKKSVILANRTGKRDTQKSASILFPIVLFLYETMKRKWEKCIPL